VISVVHLDGAQLAEPAEQLLRMLAAKPGFRSGTLARSTDDAEHWVLVTDWDDVGSYRRAFGADVRMVAMPLMAHARDLPSAFEALVEVKPDGAVTAHGSDRA
jgi:hypothetical protein